MTRIPLETRAQAAARLDARVPDPSGEPDGRGLRVDGGELSYGPPEPTPLMRSRSISVTGDTGILVYDDFNRPDGPLANTEAPSGQTWTEAGEGSWSISGGFAERSSTTNEPGFLLHPTSATNRGFQARAFWTGRELSTLKGFCPAYVDANNWLSVHCDFTEWEVEMSLDGVVTTLASGSTSSQVGQIADLFMTCRGESFQRINLGSALRGYIGGFSVSSDSDALNIFTNRTHQGLVSYRSQLRCASYQLIQGRA